MNRQVTRIELLTICLLCIVGVSFLLACIGCASPVTTMHYRIDKPIDIIITDHATIQAIWESQGHTDYAEGVFVYATRTAYVQPCQWDRTLPDFYWLGHEIWHTPELGGQWHE